MDLKDLVAVTGISGIFRMAGNRNNGLIIEDLDTGKRKFAPSRKHQFSPLESISIFTDEDSVELKKVFENMLAKESELALPASDASPAQLHAYFAQVLPEYDRDRVTVGDIKKVIKWFGFLQERNLLTGELAPAPETAAEEEE